MNKADTYIKLNRSILDWGWFTEPNTYRVFTYLILKANIKDHAFGKITVHRGELVTSYFSIAEKLRLSEKQVRTAIQHLEATGEIKRKVYNKYQVIRVVNYSKYQDSPDKSDDD